MNKEGSFRDYIRTELDSFLLARQKEIEIDSDTLKIDLHCHDKNSDQPGERLGRILGIPETWLKTGKLIECLENNRTSALTITNHNNARSCWNLLDKGYDILPGAEFTCTLPGSGCTIHVLTYGFNPLQEAKLNSLRDNLYRFLEYCRTKDILTIWAHPLYFYPNRFSPQAIDDLEHMATLFSHFEVINGQRNSWQNLITIKWLKSFDEEKIDRISRKYPVNIRNLCADPGAMIMVGGSDDHMGLFAGSTGTYVKIPDLKERLKTSTRADLILDGLRMGDVAPYGFFTEEDKMSITFLELFYGIVTQMEDPGLIRMMLHQGTKNEKLLAFLITNGINELRRHKFTMQFLKTFHKSLHGVGPEKWKKSFVKKSTKPLLGEIENIARAKKLDTEIYVRETRHTLDHLFNRLTKQIISRGGENISELSRKNQIGEIKLQEFLEKIELPASLRHLFGEEAESKAGTINAGKIFDRLSFPALASFIIGAVNFTSTKVLHDNRPFLDHFARENGLKTPAKRMLWLTDTFTDKNGIAISLNNYYDEVCRRNLPVDFLVCHETLESAGHLIVTRPLGSFPIPLYKEQSIRIPDIMAIQDIFKKGDYDRIICSTELLMGAAGIYLKQSFNVQAFFFLHTDWLEFASAKLELDEQNLNRLTRFARSFYQSFDKLIVLNRDHADWLAGPKMNIPREKIFATRHWLNKDFTRGLEETDSPCYIRKKNEKVLLFVGRLSEEKGLLDFPEIATVVADQAGPVKVIFCGSGPARAKMETLLPDALFIDWVDQSELGSVYASADFLVFPSRFDTFGRVVLEALYCGCPVAAYNEKGPKDIVEDGVSGILRNNRYDLAEAIAAVLKDEVAHRQMRNEAIKRSAQFDSEKILKQFLGNTGLYEEVEVPV
ncbi:MAG: glycosyltransferase [Spirochaetales bacterium]|nr:glycosyltransferase [Spirochaetales bacterium]